MTVLRSHFIFYVSDQALSSEFYRTVLDQEPSLNVPGMTEFDLGQGAVLGLMPESGIKKLLGGAIRDPEGARVIPRAELYLTVSDCRTQYQRALDAGATELSPVQLRNWGDWAGYLADPDGHVLAFAEPANTGE